MSSHKVGEAAGMHDVQENKQHVAGTGLTRHKVVGDALLPPLLLGVLCQGCIAHSWGSKSHASQLGLSIIPKAVQQVQRT